MPKFVIPLKKISPVDHDEFGRTFANLSLLPQVSNNYVLNFDSYDQTITPFLTKIKDLLRPVKFGNADSEFLNSLIKLLTSKINLAESVQAELGTIDSNYPLELKALVKLPGSEFEQELGIVKNKKDLEATLTVGFLSFLEKDILKKIGTSNQLDKVRISILIAPKLTVEVSGTAKITTPKKGLIEINAWWGEGQSSAADKITLNEQTFSIINYTTVPQSVQTIWSKDQFKTVAIAPKYQSERKLTSVQIQEICTTVKNLQSKLLREVKGSFVIAGGRVYFTKLEEDSETSILENIALPINLPLIQTLKPVFPGIATGIVKHIRKVSDLSKIRSGEIAVVEEVKKENIKFLKKASGVIIRSGSKLQKDHGHLISQLGVGVAIGDINSYIEGVVTLDAKSGKIYKGSFFPLVNKILEPRNKVITEKASLKTATKLFVRSVNIEHLKTADLANFDGLGPIHLKLTNAQPQQKLVDELSGYLNEVLEKTDSKTAIYQLSDFKANRSETLAAQLAIFRTLRNTFNHKNLWLSLPAVSTIKDFSDVKKTISAANVHRSTSLKFLATVTSAANIYSLDEFVEVGIDGFVIDYWELANLTYSKDFSQQELVALEDTSLEKSLEKVVSFATKHALFSGVYNLPLNSENHILKKLVSWGVKAISVEPNVEVECRELLVKYEKELVKGR